jgi:hypothetical protein
MVVYFKDYIIPLVLRRPSMSCLVTFQPLANENDVIVLKSFQETFYIATWDSMEFMWPQLNIYKNLNILRPSTLEFEELN